MREYKELSYLKWDDFLFDMFQSSDSLRKLVRGSFQLLNVRRNNLHSMQHTIHPFRWTMREYKEMSDLKRDDCLFDMCQSSNSFFGLMRDSFQLFNDQRNYLHSMQEPKHPFRRTMRDYTELRDLKRDDCLFHLPFWFYPC